MGRVAADGDAFGDGVGLSGNDLVLVADMAKMLTDID